MIYPHLTPNELVMLEAYFNNYQSVSKTSKLLQRSRQTIYNVYHFLKVGCTAVGYYEQYKKNKRKCGSRPIFLPSKQREYVQKKVVQGWAPDVLLGRSEFPISCSVRTIYRMFKDQIFDVRYLTMKEKRKPNGHKEIHGKQAFRRSIHDRKTDYDNFHQ